MIKELIEKLLNDTPMGQPSYALCAEVIQMKKAILMLAESIDLQQGEFISTNRLAREILESIDKLDAKFEKAGL